MLIAISFSALCATVLVSAMVGFVAGIFITAKIMKR